MEEKMELHGLLVSQIGYELDSALRFANTASALCVTRQGAQSSIPNREELNVFLRDRENQ